MSGRPRQNAPGVTELKVSRDSLFFACKSSFSFKICATGTHVIGDHLPLKEDWSTDLGRNP
jgi:hypothetical protein